MLDEADNLGDAFSTLSWSITLLHTEQWTTAILICGALVNLFFSLTRAHGKLMWPIIFYASGLTGVGCSYWFNMNPRAYIWFLEIGLFTICFSLILLTGALGHSDEGNSGCAKTAILIFTAAGLAATWIIMVLIVEYLEEWGLFFYNASWCAFFVVLSMVMLKTLGGLNHEVHHNVGLFGKIFTIGVSIVQIYIAVIYFIVILGDGFGNPYVWLWIGTLGNFVFNMFLNGLVFFAVYTGGVGIGEQESFHGGHFTGKKTDSHGHAEGHVVVVQTDTHYESHHDSHNTHGNY